MAEGFSVSGTMNWAQHQMGRLGDAAREAGAELKTHFLGTEEGNRYDNGADIVSMAIKGDPTARELVGEAAQHGLSSAIAFVSAPVVATAVLTAVTVPPLAGPAVLAAGGAIVASAAVNPEVRQAIGEGRWNDVFPATVQSYLNAFPYVPGPAQPYAEFKAEFARMTPEERLQRTNNVLVGELTHLVVSSIQKHLNFGSSPSSVETQPTPK